MNLRDKLVAEQLVQHTMFAQYDRASKTAWANYVKRGRDEDLHESIRNAYKAEAAAEKISWIQTILDSTNANN